MARGALCGVWLVLRYPKDKTELTGVEYEPWHYRYVGVETARYLTENGLCLEEL